MATFYVSSVDGDNADTGADWANAKATVAGALAVATNAADIIYVDSAHNFTSGAAITWDKPTAHSHCAIISVNRATGAWLAGAKETVGVNAVNFDIGSSGSQRLYIYGVEIVANNDAGANSINIATATLTVGSGYVGVAMENCSLTIPGTNAGSRLNLGHSGSRTLGELVLKNCTFTSRNNTSVHAILVNGIRVFASGLTHVYAGANKSANLFGNTGSVVPGYLEVVDSDLSGFDAGAYISVISNWVSAVFRNCKLHATPTRVDSGTWDSSAKHFTFINCDSGNTKSVIEHYTRIGTLLESGTIYAASGAQHSGAAISWQIVTTASCREGEPYISPWVIAPHDGTAQIDLTLELNHDSATALHNRNCWMEVEYISNAGFPEGTLVSTRNAQPFDGTAVNLTASTVAWTGTGGWGNENKQKITHRFTPAQTGLIRARLCVATASKTLYVDPQLRIAAV